MKWTALLLASLSFCGIAYGEVKIKQVSTVTAYFMDDAGKDLFSAFVPSDEINREGSFNFRDRNFGFWLNVESEREGQDMIYGGHIEVSRVHYNVVETGHGYRFSLAVREAQQLYRAMRGARVGNPEEGVTTKEHRTSSIHMLCWQSDHGYIPYACEIEFFGSLESALNEGE